jgi:ATP-dependent Clp protease adaptor protein ClpS
MTNPDKERGLSIADKSDEEYQKPKMWKVVIFNDDFTPMDFVTDIFVKIFRKSITEAERLMLEVHNSGSAVAGVYTHEIAETKVARVHQEAQTESHPLMCNMEPE